jgi:Protein kinase domain
MNRLLLLLFLVLILFGSCSAQELRRIRFQVSPPNAQVEALNENLEWDRLENKDGIVTVDVSKYTLFRFSAPGYEPREEPIAIKALRAEGIARWPSSGTLELKPLPFTRFKLFLLRFGWLFLVALIVAVRVKKLRLQAAEKEQQVEYLEKLQKEAQQSKDTVLGQRIGKYLLTAFLGKGGMAVVYRGTAAKDGRTGEQVAVKVLSADRDEQSILRFKREVKICQKLIHPNIVALHDWGEDGDLVYLAMELIEGGCLEDRLAEFSDVPKALLLFDQILAGTEFAHSQGVTHRDLKPDNILLTENGRPKITDFGLAKLQDIKTVTVTGAVMGTPAYMAPEQIQDEPPSPSMDQYSLGVLGYQLLTGHLPFEAQDMMAVITKHLIEEPPHPKTFNDALSDELCDLLLKMLEKDPNDRFTDLGEVRRALKALPEQNL